MLISDLFVIAGAIRVFQDLSGIEKEVAEEHADQKKVDHEETDWVDEAADGQ